MHVSKMDVGKVMKNARMGFRLIVSGVVIVLSLRLLIWHEIRCCHRLIRRYREYAVPQN